ncbi:MAG: tail fiber domain-containing protein [bacterium]|nr:tail fiber domain-containing protein [bacterium]
MKNKLSGFSLMEMLVVLLIIAIVMAASAPMVNRKMLSTMAEKSPWVWTNTTGSIAYNLNGNDNQTTTIGAMALPSGSEKARLYISNSGTADGQVSGTNKSTQTPQIALGGAVNNDTDPLFYIHKYGTSLAISSKKVYIPTSSSSGSGVPSTPSASAPVEGAISIGNNAEATKSNGIALGAGAEANSPSSVAIGHLAGTVESMSGGENIAIGLRAKAKHSGSIVIGADTADNNGSVGNKDVIAIGRNAKAYGDNSIAIGHNAQAQGATSKDNTIAIGLNASALGNNAVAIGAGAVADADNKIVIGTEDSIVYIPGQLRLKVGRFVYKITPDNGTVKTTIVGILNGTSSDRRLKNVGEVFTGGLEQIKKLEVFNYTFKKDTEKTPRVGVMAQDLQKIFPNAVFKGEDGFLRIRMEDMFYALVNAVKELDAKVQMIVDKNIAGLKKQIADLEEENRVITEKNVALEKQIASLYEQNAKLEERMNVIEKQLANKKNK